MFSQSAFNTIKKNKSKIAWRGQIGEYGSAKLYSKNHNDKEKFEHEVEIWKMINNRELFPTVLYYLYDDEDKMRIISEYNTGHTVSKKIGVLSNLQKADILSQLYLTFWHLNNMFNAYGKNIDFCDIVIKNLSPNTGCKMKFKINNVWIISSYLCQIYNFDKWQVKPDSAQDMVVNFILLVEKFLNREKSLFNEFCIFAKVPNFQDLCGNKEKLYELLISTARVFTPQEFNAWLVSQKLYPEVTDKLIDNVLEFSYLDPFTTNTPKKILKVKSQIVEKASNPFSILEVN